jgi:carboxypeptidase Q
MALEALNVLRRLELRPRRTIRVVLWTGEEIDMVGAEQYAKEHAGELPRHVAAIEADLGCARPVSYGVDCADPGRLEIAAGRMREILSLCQSVGSIEVRPGESGMDVGLLKPGGVIVMGHDMDPARYFDYHHSPADTLDKIDPQELARNVAVMATVAYVIADLPERLGEQ